MRRGSENSDPLELGKDGRISSRYNRGGGILGGISTGEDIVARLAIKPTSSIAMEQDTIDVRGRKSKISVHGRHDPCLCPRIVPVAEAMTLLVICDLILLQRAKTGKPGPAGRIGKK
jgi:chorismate synthase